MSRVLIFERANGLRRDLEAAVRNAGYEVDAVGDLEHLNERIGHHACRLALVDVGGPEDLEWMGRLARSAPRPIVFAMGSSPSVELAVASMKHGARHYLRKPFRIESLEWALSSAMVTGDRNPRAYDRANFVAQDPYVVDLIRQSEAAAASNATVLIVGEGGTGKKALARRIHAFSGRRNGPLVGIDCASLSDAGAEAELFGREPGALIEAAQGREGQVASADGGTLLLDNVSEASPSVQAVLLRFLEEREVTAVGASIGRAIDCRVVATSRVDLRHEVAEGRFREDLFYRLDVVVLPLPALRDRRSDVRLLAETLLRRHVGNAETGAPLFSESDFEALEAHDFRGNVRELDNLMQRAVVHFGGRPVDLDRLLTGPGNVVLNTRTHRTSLNLRELERQAVERSLSESNGNRTHASQLLGINVRTLRNKIRAYGLS